MLADSVIASLQIPPRPEIVIALQEELRHENADMATIKRLIAADVALAGAMLKTINSAAFNVGRKVGSVAQAIDLLGLKKVNSLISGLAIKAMLNFPDKPALVRFWDTSERVAQTCAAIARRLRGISPEDAYTYGLFHDSGIAVLMGRFEHYGKSLSIASRTPDVRFTSFEDEAVGTNHAVVGYFLARSWAIPSEDLCRAILLHHEIDAYSTQSADTIGCLNYVSIGHIASQINHTLVNAADNPEWIKFWQSALGHFGLDNEDLLEMIDYIEALR